ncbi:hypothetical protein A6S26_34330 [Nostoc sp. ATCC 43529]|nr:hypothetical protein A6S26_34330 [Nostoc sp. ATCC 43529]
MTSESTVKLTITLNEPDSDEERLDQITRNLLREIKELDGVEQAGLAVVGEIPEGAKSIGSILIGILNAEVSLTSFKTFVGFLWERLAGNPVELEVEANGKKLKVKASSRQELLAAIQAAEQFVAGYEVTYG